MRGRVRRPDPRKVTEREIVVKAMTCSKPLRRAYWTLFVAVHRENLMRSELTPAQEADCLKRRKELWERRISAELQPKIGRGRPDGFAGDVEKRTGKDKATVNQSIRRAARIENVAELSGTSLDKGVELDALAKLPPEARQ